MSNRIDFYQSAQTSLAIPAASISIFIEGELCPVLEVIEIIRESRPNFSRAGLTYNPAAYAQAGITAAEDIESKFAMGKTVCIRQYYNGVPPGAATFSLPIFCGQIDGIEKQVSPNGEQTEITARDFSANMERVTVYGQRAAAGNSSDMFLSSLQTVFNPDGTANAGKTPIQLNGKSYTAFCAGPSQAKLWSYAEAIHYLLCEYVPTDQLQTPTIDQLKALTENLVIRDIDVTSLNLIEALHRCCEGIGLRFKFVPNLAPAGPEQAIVFYKVGTGRTIELNHQQSGEQLNISKTNIAALQSRKYFHPVTHKYIGQGDFMLFEATFDLVKAWDPALEDSDYDKFSPVTNPDFYQVSDVYRKWCLNEAGQYSEASFNQGDAFDFSNIFESSNFTHRCRRFKSCLSTDKLGKSLGYYLQVSYDSGQNWSQYLYGFDNLLDECGVWLSSETLDYDTWSAAQAGTLRFRITATVESDERLSCEVADGPVNSAAPVIEHILSLPNQYKYQKVAGQSIFKDDDSLGKPDEADDSQILFEFIRQTASISTEVTETIDIHTPTLALNYEVGDIVNSSPESRDLLACRSDNRNIRLIELVQMDFQKQCTNLKIIRQRKKQ